MKRVEILSCITTSIFYMTIISHFAILIFFSISFSDDLRDRQISCLNLVVFITNDFLLLARLCQVFRAYQ